MSLFFIIFLSTCITPLETEPLNPEDFLVVQGFITDDFGPHNIRISRLVEFAGVQEGGVITIEEAEVRIIDQDDNAVTLERLTLQRREKREFPCTIRFVPFTTDYRTPETFKGVIGSTYVLEVVTMDDKVYRSKPQTILPTPPIDSLSLAFKELPSLDPIVPESGVEVFVTLQDPPEEENYYFWRINGIYRINTPLRVSEGLCCSFDPMDGGSDDCWILEKNIRGNEIVFSDQRVNGERITFPVGVIKDDALRFSNQRVSAQKQYYVELEQYRIPLEAFLFNERVKLLSNINGEIFDPPPLSIRGNVFNISDSKDDVIGYFGAYAKQTKGKFVQRSLLKFVRRFPNLCGDCRVLAGAQLERPEPYKN